MGFVCPKAGKEQDGHTGAHHPGGPCAHWDKNRITWHLKKDCGPSSGKIYEAEALKSLEKAFKVWEQAADVKFSKVIIPPEDIQIRFVSGSHHDGDEKFPCESFDGPGGVLAHTCMPELKNATGNIHFDDSENWTLCSTMGINFFQVAVHEIGHSLGLKHSSVPSAVMFPTYQGYKPNFKLDRDDIDAIQKLYGPPKVSKSPDANEHKRQAGCGHSGHVYQTGGHQVYHTGQSLYQTARSGSLGGTSLYEGGGRPLYLATKGQRSLDTCKEVSGQGIPEIQSMEMETRQLCQPKISKLAGPDPSTSLSKIYPQLKQLSPSASQQGSSWGISGSTKENPKESQGHHGGHQLTHQHWQHHAAHHAGKVAQAKTKFFKWSILAFILVSIAIALFLVIRFWK